MSAGDEGRQLKNRFEDFTEMFAVNTAHVKLGENGTVDSCLENRGCRR